MFVSPSVSQTEFDTYSGRKIHWLSGTQRRFELDLLRGPHGRFIQAVAQAADHAVDLHGPICQEDHVHNHVAFNLHRTPFGGVFGFRFAQNRRRIIRRTAGLLLFLGGFRGLRRVCKAGGGDRAFLAATRRRVGGAVTKSGAGYRAANSFFAARAVAVSLTARQRWRTEARHVRRVFRIALAGYPIRIAEPAGLHFFHGSDHRCWCRASRTQVVDLHVLLRTLGPVLFHINLYGLELRRHIGIFDFYLFHLRFQSLWRDQVGKNVRLLRIQFRGLRWRRRWLRYNRFYLRRCRRRWRRSHGNQGNRLSDGGIGILNGGF